MLNPKKIKVRPLLIHLIVTLIYPVFRACTAEKNGLMLLTDALTVTCLVMIIGGVIYALFLKGDFDISRYLMKRGVQKEPKQSFNAYLFEVYEKREDAFNYPLFVGLLYVAVSAVLAWCVV